MPRKVRESKLETRTARLKLPIAKKPRFTKVGPRIGLGYRRNHTVGTWVLRVADGKGGNWTKAIGLADDFDDANGKTILTFWQAQERALGVARSGPNGDDVDITRPATVDQALDRYEADLESRGGDVGNVVRVRAHISQGMCAKSVALLTSQDLRTWRDALITHLAPATVNRTCAALKAALNLAAEHDERIASRRPWEVGLASIPDAEQSRNVILAEAVIRDIVAAAYEQNAAFGLLVELAAVTGSRVSQLARLEVQDLQNERDDPRLMMPTSRKGRSQKKISRRPVPILAGLATRLHEANGSPADGPPSR